MIFTSGGSSSVLAPDPVEHGGAVEAAEAGEQEVEASRCHGRRCRTGGCSPQRQACWRRGPGGVGRQSAGRRRHTEGRGHEGTRPVGHVVAFTGALDLLRAASDADARHPSRQFNRTKTSDKRVSSPSPIHSHNNHHITVTCSFPELTLSVYGHEGTSSRDGEERRGEERRRDETR